MGAEIGTTQVAAAASNRPHRAELTPCRKPTGHRPRNQLGRWKIKANPIGLAKLSLSGDMPSSAIQCHFRPFIKDVDDRLA